MILSLISCLFVISLSSNPLETELDKAKAQHNVLKCKELLGQLDSCYPKLSWKEDLPLTKTTSNRPAFHHIRWGSDRVVDSCFEYQSISTDARRDSVIFVASARRSGPGDTFDIDVRYSPDGGYTWQWFATIGANGYDHNFYNPSLKILESDDSSFMFIAFEAEPVSNPSEGYIGIWRFSFNSWSDTLFYVSDIPGIKEADPGLDDDDIQFPYLPYLYCIWQQYDTIVFARSVNLGKNWTDHKILNSGNNNIDYYDPECAFGWYDLNDDSITIAACWEYHHLTMNRKRVQYNYNWAFGNDYAWENYSLSLIPASSCIEYSPDIVAAHHAPGAVITFSRRDTITGNTKAAYSYTYTGFMNQCGAIDSSVNSNFLTSLGIDDSCGRYHLFYYNGTDVKYTDIRYDSLAEHSWSSPIVINNSPIDTTIRQKAATIDGQPMVIWVENDIAQQKIKFDAEWNTAGLETQNFKLKNNENVYVLPNPTRGKAILYMQSEAKIQIFNVIGKKIKEISLNKNGNHEITFTDMAQGIYFLHVKTSEEDVLIKTVVIK